MTLEQIKKLTDEELRIKVAELLGWFGFVNSKTTGKPVVCGHYKNSDGSLKWGVPPDYPADLNACHEMERTLTDDDVIADYCTVLFDFVDQESFQRGWLTISATARQRCEAFCMVMEGQ